MEGKYSSEIPGGLPKCLKCAQNGRFSAYLRPFNGVYIFYSLGTVCQVCLVNAACSAEAGVLGSSLFFFETLDKVGRSL
jgi:hypothetical protein